MVRVVAYIDGFNLYFGLKARHGRRYLWLDLQALVLGLMRPGQTLEQITYFTARVRNDPEGRQRQSYYLDALASHSPLVTIVDGRFQEKPRHCRNCGAAWTVYEEKETDVSIAAALIEDAVLDRYDTALLISADSDLCPAIITMKRLRPEKRIIAVFPPRRHSADLKRAVDAYLSIGDDKIRKAQLPPEVVNNAGITLRRPKYWT
ncbi:MAG: NYN domain-containing protein [Pseudonocardiaceae bacterium]